ncbi:hypothetical protein [Sphingomonas panacis]|uniref:hypothetical protein n=1 Tax=Sphingomonas panacis TaxID=1560345 RepID=UPI0012378275|nr:hypothetical protein [Sphingomonas panacis]
MILDGVTVARKRARNGSGGAAAPEAAMSSPYSTCRFRIGGPDAARPMWPRATAPQSDAAKDIMKNRSTLFKYIFDTDRLNDDVLSL